MAAFTRAEGELLARARVGRLATADTVGRPHVVPIVFAVDEQRLYSPLDAKPKRVGARELKRVRNLCENPQVAVVVDEYEEDWAKLAWVMIRGTAEIVESGGVHAAGVRLLHAKYRQYSAMPLDDRPLIVVTPTSVTSWHGSQSGRGGSSPER